MRFDKVTLSNLRSHRNTEFALERVNVIRGANGSGKSTLQMAISYALTGRCGVTDAAGRGSENLITIGAKQFTITLQHSAGPTIQVTRSRAGGHFIVIDDTDPKKLSYVGVHAQQWVETNLGNVEVLSAVLDSGRFVEMSEKEQKALLAGALAAEPVAIDAEILAIMRADLFPQAPDTVATAAQVDSVYKVAYEQRTLANRSLKDIGTITQPNIPAECPPLADVRKQVAELQRQRDAIVAKRARTVAEYDAEKRAYTEAVATREAAEKNMLPNADLEAMKDAPKAKARAVELDREIVELRASITNQRSSLSSLKSPQQANCPTCKQPWPQKDRSGEIAELEAEIDFADKLLAEKNAHRLKLGDVDNAANRLEAHRKALADFARAEKVILAGEPKPSDTAALDLEIEALDARITKGHEVSDQVSKYEGAREQHAQQVARKEQLEGEAAALDKLCDYFGPKGGLKARLIGGRLPEFRDRINEVLARFGFCCGFELEPYSLKVSRRPPAEVEYELGEAVPPVVTFLTLSQLSESEQYRFGIAFQLALAEATGVRFCIIDRADMLSSGARSALIQVLLESSLDQCLVLATGEPMDEFPQIPGTAFYELENIDGETLIRASHVNDARKSVSA